MSCCGEPKQYGATDSANRPPPPPQPYPVTQQPQPQALPQFTGGQFPGQTPSPAPPQPVASAYPPWAPNGNGYPQQNGYNMPMAQTGYQQNGFPQPPHTASPTLVGSPTPTATATATGGSGYQPSMMTGVGSGFVSPPVPVTMPAATGAAPTEEGRMVVSIDFGTTFSGVAYGSSRVTNGNVQMLLTWPGSFHETFRKVPTCLLYDETGRVIAWGLEAKNASPIEGTIRCEWFKLFLEPQALRDPNTVDPRLPKLPPGKQALDLVVDYLSCMWEYAKDQITREINTVADLESADVWLTVPAAWDAKGCDLMREAAIRAGLVQNAHAGDKNWRERLRIITEPEAAAVHAAHLSNLHTLKPSQVFMVVDAGGGTVDLAIYKLIGQLANLEIAEVCARSGANCGSLFLDLRFRELVRMLLASHPAHLDPASLAYFMHAFSETDKLAYRGEIDDDTFFRFTCFNVEDADDPSVGLENGELAIPGNLLRREVFDPVIAQVLALIEEQVARCEQRIDAIIMVGGFSGSEYLYGRVQQQLGNRVKVITRPSDADTACLRGASEYGLAKRTLVSSVVAPRGYIMKVKLPAEQEDWMKRPAYIHPNNAGAQICENRLQYLISKGAILRKGQLLKTKFCKFSATPADRQFVAVLYTSDTTQVYRYTDEGEIQELCKWTVDLASLPSFQMQAKMSGGTGFYTEFELGLELDSAEVRGVLLYNDEVWGRVTFDFIN